MSYIVESRYQYIDYDGIKMTKWFAKDVRPMTEEEAKAAMKHLIEDTKEFDKKTKLKHEFRLGSYEDYIDWVQQSKAKAEKALEDEKAYRKSQEYKDMQKRKRQQAKELKERKEAYEREHGKS